MRLSERITIIINCTHVGVVWSALSEMLNYKSRKTKNEKKTNKTKQKTKREKVV